MDFSLIFTDYTIRNVALGALVLGTVSGTLSAYAVLRKQSLLGDAMSHAALPGIVVAFLLTGTRSLPLLMIGAIVAGWLGTLFMLLVTSQTRIKQDAAQGVVLAVFFGFGMALLSWVLRQNNAQHAGLNNFLFGKAAATVASDVNTMAIVGAIVLVLVAVFWKEFKLLSFDPGYASTLGFPVRRLDVLLTTLIVVVVVVGLQMVGVVLMSAMLVAPGVAARQWTNRLGIMVPLSAGIGALAGVGGALTSSFEANLPTGPLIVLFVSGFVIISLLFAPERGILWELAQRYRNGRRLREAAVLETLYQLGLHHGDPLHPHSLASLKAALSPEGVRYTLEHLVQEGLVRRVNGGEWALTPQGVETLHRLAPAMVTQAARDEQVEVLA
jgi:manganese/zinc/iron transport system permease protein